VNAANRRAPKWRGALGVWSPKAQRLNSSNAIRVVPRVHGVVPIPAERIGIAIPVVDTIVLKLEKVAIRDLIPSGRGRIKNDYKV
jgi:hypothetical protein